MRIVDPTGQKNYTLGYCSIENVVWAREFGQNMPQSRSFRFTFYLRLFLFYFSDFRHRAMAMLIL